MKKILLSLLLLSLLSFVAHAKAYFSPQKEMVQRAEAIAIVQIKQIKHVHKQGSFWSYGQQAIGTVETSIKGDLPTDIEIYGKERFICAQSLFSKGRFLLFLRKDGELWIGSNWDRGIKAIKNEKVAWGKDSSYFPHEERPLSEVILEIQHILKEKEN